MANKIEIGEIRLWSKDRASVAYTATVHGCEYKPKSARLADYGNGWEASRESEFTAFCTWQGEPKHGGLTTAARKWIEPRVIEALTAYATPERLAIADRANRDAHIERNNEKIVKLEKELEALRAENEKLA